MFTEESLSYTYDFSTPNGTVSRVYMCVNYCPKNEAYYFEAEMKFKCERYRKTRWIKASSAIDAICHIDAKSAAHKVFYDIVKRSDEPEG